MQFTLECCFAVHTPLVTKITRLLLLIALKLWQKFFQFSWPWKKKTVVVFAAEFPISHHLKQSAASLYSILIVVKWKYSGPTYFVVFSITHSTVRSVYKWGADWGDAVKMEENRKCEKWNYSERSKVFWAIENWIELKFCYACTQVSTSFRWKIEMVFFLYISCGRNTGRQSANQCVNLCVYVWLTITSQAASEITKCLSNRILNWNAGGKGGFNCCGFSPKR